MSEEKRNEKKEKQEKRKLSEVEKALVDLTVQRRLKIIIPVILFLAAALTVLILKSCGKEDDRELSERITETIEDVIVGQEGKVELVTESTLESAVKNATLYTAAYPYNGVAQVYGTVEEGCKYYVAYKATIKAGIDSSKIRVELDKEKNTIIIHLPEVELTEPSIDGKFRFIFMDEKYNTGDTYNEAFTAATADINRRIKLDMLEELKKTATDSAKAVERALVEPWVNQVDPERQYTVRVLAYGEEE
ncbi:MAG: DUF4230 domain-containing protein [Lachnospiraceae bacterium]|nr:DUF4230 domain-containing protein [Lachnospiraceae bacterium]